MQIRLYFKYYFNILYNVKSTSKKIFAIYDVQSIVVSVKFLKEKGGFIRRALCEKQRLKIKIL